MSKMPMATKDFRFTLKSADDETGTFTGILSAYNIIDLGNDLVEPGAFTKNLKEAGEDRVLLWQHNTDEPIGGLKIWDTPEGLMVKGTLDLNIQRAREAYSLLKNSFIKGLSIGYRAIKKKMEDGIRHLKEIELFEGSIVTFPMLPAAQVTGVKRADGVKDFEEELAEAQTMAMYYLMMSSLDDALCDIRWDQTLSPDDKVQQSGESIDQFKTRYMEYLPAYFSAIADDDDDADMSISGRKPGDVKVGRRISAASRTKVEEAISKLQALLAEDESQDTADETAAALPPPAVAAAPKESGDSDFLAQFNEWLNSRSISN